MLFIRTKVYVLRRSPGSRLATGGGIDGVSSTMGNVWYVYGSLLDGPWKSVENELPEINKPGIGRLACIQSGPDVVPRSDFSGLQYLFAPSPHGDLILIALACINLQGI
jgi:hypothetical protein